MAHDRSSSSSLVRGDTSGWEERFVEDVWRGFLSRFRPNPFTMNDGGDRHDQSRTSPRQVSLPLALLQGESTSAVATGAEYRACEDVAEVRP